MTRFCNLESRWPTLEGKLNFFLRQTEDNITPTYGACGACCSCGANGAYSVVYSPLHVVLEDLVSPCAAVLVGLRAAAEHIAAGVAAQEGRKGQFCLTRFLPILLNRPKSHTQEKVLIEN